jgi:hypothetical protein
MGLKQTLEVINAMEADGVIARYAIGDAVAAYNYIEPTVAQVIYPDVSDILARKEERRREISLKFLPIDLFAILGRADRGVKAFILSSRSQGNVKRTAAVPSSEAKLCRLLCALCLKVALMFDPRILPHDDAVERHSLFLLTVLRT